MKKKARVYTVFFLLILASFSACATPKEHWDRESDLQEQALLKRRRSATSAEELKNIDEEIDLLKYKRNGVDSLFNVGPSPEEEHTKVQTPLFGEEKQRAVNDSVDKELERLNTKRN